MVNPEAETLNRILQEKAPAIYSLLSEKGKNAFFPRKGILQQSAEAKSAKINATIGQAFEDDGNPMVLDSLANQTIMPNKDVFLYSPSYGQKELREEWQKSIKKKNPSLNTMMSLPVATNGLTHALFVAGRMFVNPGEKVITPNRYWENYGLTFEDAQLDEFNLFNGRGFNIEGLASKLEGYNSKKIILLNFPNNPTGYTPTVKEADQIKEVLKDSAERNNRIVAICDDAYFGLVYEDDVEKESIFSKIAGLDERIIAVKADGISKEMYSWGLRTGFLSYGFKGMKKECAEALEDKTAGFVRGTISNISTQSQMMALNALRSPLFDEQAKAKYDVLKERYDLVKDELRVNSEYAEHFEALPFNSGYFMCVKLHSKNPEIIRKILIQKYSTGLISGEDTLRVAYSAIPKDKIPQLFANIYRACKE